MLQDKDEKGKKKQVQTIIMVKYWIMFQYNFHQVGLHNKFYEQNEQPVTEPPACSEALYGTL